MADDVGRRDDRAVDDVVGDVEQAADELRIAVDGFKPRGCLTTKPPFAPTGTMTAFFTICALTSPSTSVRKSSRRSDQRSPPRATGPKRRCTPSTRGEYTKISYAGRGAGRSGTSRGFSLTAKYPFDSPSPACWK